MRGTATTSGATAYPIYGSTENFGNGNFDSAPGEDPDGDGLNNAAEFLLGTDPNKSSENFTTTLSPDGNFLKLPRVLSQNRYLLEESDNLSVWRPTDFSLVPDVSGDDVTIPLPTRGDEDRMFHRVRVESRQ